MDKRKFLASAPGSGSSAVTDQLRDQRDALTAPERGSIPVAFPIAHGAVMIDFCGPWEVFHSADIPGHRGDAFQTYTVAETLEPITASGGMKIVPNYTFQTAPAPKVVVIPA
jgi:transcriptional regulator GlxA family with amidase domain